MNASNKKRMIFAKVDVTLPHHQRVLRLPKDKRDAALGLWLRALCYTRGQELDGFCPLEELEAPGSTEIIDWLVTVGLLAREEQDGVHGVRVLRYELHNETKAEIESRKLADRQRKHNSTPPSAPTDSKRHRKGRQKDSHRIPNGIQTKGIPDSDSVSDSDRIHSEISDSSGQVTLEPPALPSSGRLPEGVYAFERPFWIAAYERAVREAGGGADWSMPQKQISALRAVVESRASAEERKDMGAFIESEVREFVRSVLCLGVPVGIYSALGPDGLQRWYNEGRPGRDGQPSATRMRASVPLQPLGDGPRLWKVGK
jgi:hypothetical protein